MRRMRTKAVEDWLQVQRQKRHEVCFGIEQVGNYQLCLKFVEGREGHEGQEGRAGREGWHVSALLRGANESCPNLPSLIANSLLEGLRNRGWFDYLDMPRIIIAAVSFACELADLLFFYIGKQSESWQEWQIREVWPRLESAVILPILSFSEPPKSIAPGRWRIGIWDLDYFKTGFAEVGYRLEGTIKKASKEGELGHYFHLGRSAKNIEIAVCKHIDYERKLRHEARDPADKILYSLRRGGWRSREVARSISWLGQPMSDDEARQRYSRLEREMREPVRNPE